MKLTHETINSNGTKLHLTWAGSGPLVVFCHGFPGLWYSWHRQLESTADAGFTVVAFDQRGYGQSDRPMPSDDYDSEIHCRDLLAILAHFQQNKAFFVGQDFGAPLVWNMGVRYPQHCHAIIAVSCPYDFDLAGHGGETAAAAESRQYQRGFALPHVKPTDCFAAIAEHQFIHLHYFQQIGPADKELGDNAAEFLKRIYWALSSRGNLLGWEKHPSEGTGYLDVLEPAPELPWEWMTQQDFDYMTRQYLLSGADKAFIGGLNNYRVADRNWEISEQYAGDSVDVPTLFISGADDPVLLMVGDDALSIMKDKAPELEDIILIENAGHFVQLEQAEAFNAHLLSFLTGQKNRLAL